MELRAICRISKFDTRVAPSLIGPIFDSSNDRALATALPPRVITALTRPKSPHRCAIDTKVTTTTAPVEPSFARERGGAARLGQIFGCCHLVSLPPATFSCLWVHT